MKMKSLFRMVCLLSVLGFAHAEEMTVDFLTKENTQVDEAMAKTLKIGTKDAATERVFQYYTAKGKQVERVTLKVVQATKIARKIEGFGEPGDVVWLVTRRDEEKKTYCFELVNSQNGNVMTNTSVKNPSSDTAPPEKTK